MVPGAQTVNEDTPLSLSGISVNDVDATLSTVQLGVVNGTVSVILQGSATISARQQRDEHPDLERQPSGHQCNSGEPHLSRGYGLCLG